VLISLYSETYINSAKWLLCNPEH